MKSKFHYAWIIAFVTFLVLLTTQVFWMGIITMHFSSRAASAS